MKTKEEVEKWMREEVSHPMIGQLIMKMTEDGLPMDEILEMIKPLVDNTPNVERKLVEDYMRDERIEDGDSITSKIEYFADIAELYDFETVFSVYEVEDVNELSGITADYMTNGLDDIHISDSSGEKKFDLTWGQFKALKACIKKIDK